METANQTLIESRARGPSLVLSAIHICSVLFSLPYPLQSFSSRPTASSMYISPDLSCPSDEADTDLLLRLLVSTTEKTT